MTRVDTTELRIETGDRLVTDVSREVGDFCRGRGDGLLNVFVPHATAGVALIETGSGSEGDLADTLDRLLPPDDRYAHRHGSPGHGRDHVLPAFVAPAVTLPVVAGVPALGTWQSVVLVDSNSDNRTRRVRLSFLAG
jgi:secondary thiamine-phosphate synthase enzyme